MSDRVRPWWWARGISAAWFPPLASEEVEVAAVVDLNTDSARARIAEFGLASEATDDPGSGTPVAPSDFVVDLTFPNRTAR